MYKFVMYCLIGLAGYSMLLSVFGITGFDLLSTILSLSAILGSGLFLNKIISLYLKIPVNQDSQIITSLILFLLYSPSNKPTELILLLGISMISVLSKYLFTVNKTHIFNPAAIAALISGSIFQYPATWWVGSEYMLPAVILAAILILRKQRKYIFSGLFLLVSITILYINYSQYYPDILNFIYEIATTWPLIFFVSVMVTEPFTLPGHKIHSYIYAVIVAVISTSPFKIYMFGTTPELALIIGNILSFIWEPRARYVLTFTNKNQLSDEIYEFEFKPDIPVKFQAGQYIELTMPHENPDNRGERRFFTISASPSDQNVSFGIRIPKNSSTFKKNLLKIQNGNTLWAQQLKGNFTLNDHNKKYVFIAGGIGITPYISMFRYLLSKSKKIDAKLYYVVSRENDLVYQDTLCSVEKNLNIPVKKIITKKLTKSIIINDSPDYMERIYYISGPNPMVNYYLDLLHNIGIKKTNIRTDFFNGA